MATFELPAQKREVFGKNHMNRLRVGGRIPGVLYGHQEEPVPLSVAETALKNAFQQGGNVILNVSIEGMKGPKTALMKEVQRDPISGKIVHIDLYQISMKRNITVRVALRIVGDSVGVRDGGILEHHLREVEVKCLPTAIPPFINVDVSLCQVGDSIHVSDLRVPEGVEIVTSKKEAVVMVSVPTEIKETAVAAAPEAAAAASAPAGPEVIGEKEREERRAATDKAKEEKKKEKEEAKA